ncbi:hypothetical protein WJX77_000662 [Trebouxia sp. C0004]
MFFPRPGMQLPFPSMQPPFPSAAAGIEAYLPLNEGKRRELQDQGFGSFDDTLVTDQLEDCLALSAFKTKRCKVANLNLAKLFWQGQADLWMVLMTAGTSARRTMFSQSQILLVGLPHADEHAQQLTLACSSSALVSMVSLNSVRTKFEPASTEVAANRGRTESRAVVFLG